MKRVSSGSPQPCHNALCCSTVESYTGSKPEVDHMPGSTTTPWPGAPLECLCAPLASKVQYVIFFGTNLAKLSKLMLNICLLYNIYKEWSLFNINFLNFFGDLLGYCFHWKNKMNALITDCLHVVIESTVSIRGKSQAVSYQLTFSLKSDILVLVYHHHIWMFIFYIHLGASFIKFITLESNIYIYVFLLHFAIWKQILNHYNFFLQWI